MPFALIITGIIMVVAAVRGTHVCLVNTVKGEFTGKGNFTYWVVAILILGLIGYSETLRPLSNGLLILILLALFLTRGRQGLFTNLTSALHIGSGSSTSASGLVSTLTGG
jgi:hypothetical protein